MLGAGAFPSLSGPFGATNRQVSYWARGLKYPLRRVPFSRPPYFNSEQCLLFMQTEIGTSVAAPAQRHPHRWLSFLAHADNSIFSTVIKTRLVLPDQLS